MNHGYLEMFLYFTFIIILVTTLLLGLVLTVVGFLLSNPATRQALWRGYKAFCAAMLVIVIVIWLLLFWLMGSDIAAVNTYLPLLISIIVGR